MVTRIRFAFALFALVSSVLIGSVLALDDASKPSLRLEAFIDGKSALYPGQRTRLVYRYYYSGDIALTQETLPLLDAMGMIKIGEKEIHDSVEGKTSIREIAQVVEAVKPGVFSYGPSVVEGRAYLQEIGEGEKLAAATLRSEASPVVVEVLPFPEEGKPPSFNGAVGKYQFQATLESPPDTIVDELLKLKLRVAGKGNIKAVPMPNLCCQPGYSGYFFIDDLPPQETVDKETKTFDVEMRALTSLAKEIPPIEFSYFDPELSGYAVLHSKAIPITVKGRKREENGRDAEAAPTGGSPKDVSKVEPLAIADFYPLATADLHDRLFGGWWALLVLPLGAALLLWQVRFKAYLESLPAAASRMDSSAWFVKAWQKRGACDYIALEQAFLTALLEVGSVKELPSTIDALPDNGTCSAVKAFWNRCEEARFGGVVPVDLVRLRAEAESLMRSTKEEGHG